MNIAIIFAGGTGQRMNSKSKPKQFLEIHGKPIIIYTLDIFEKHNEIDAIVVVMLENWIDYMHDLLDRYGIKKVNAIIPGGKNGQHSIRNGVYEAKKLFPDDSVVLIHDGVRPLINGDLITKNIQQVRSYGNSITVSPAIETIISVKDDENREIEEVLDRSRCMMARAPQSFLLKDIYDAHRKADAEGFDCAIDSAMLMRKYGYKLHMIEGVPENIKITTPTDYYIFKAILDERENSQIFGV